MGMDRSGLTCDVQEIETGQISDEGPHQRSCLTGVKNDNSSCFVFTYCYQHSLCIFAYARHHANESH